MFINSTQLLNPVEPSIYLQFRSNKALELYTRSWKFNKQRLKQWELSEEQSENKLQNKRNLIKSVIKVKWAECRWRWG